MNNLRGEMNDYLIRKAIPADAEGVRQCVKSAYRHYERLIGGPPGPMIQDYAKVIDDCDVYVAAVGRKIHGILVLDQTEEGYLLDNVAVSPDSQGKGLGRLLLDFAESSAKSAGYDSIYLYTNVKMYGNQELYSRMGYQEYDRRTEKGFSRVYMRKHLTSDAFLPAS